MGGILPLIFLLLFHELENFTRFRRLITKVYALDVLPRTRLRTSLELIVDGFRKS
jgi:hypothetical protein